jgi:chemotaxis protein MotA
MRRFDASLFLGLLIGLAAILGGAWFENIALKFLWQPTALLIVVGGTTGAIVIRRGLGGAWSAARASASLFLQKETDESEATLARLMWLARAAKKDGVRVLENHAKAQTDALVARALALAAEQADATTMRATLARLIAREDEEGLRDVGTLDAAGGFAPTFGIIGAVLGLIHVLRSIDEPGALGFGIATAFVATLYGVGIANLLLFPLAARLRERHAARMQQREALAEALLALAARELPSVIAQRFTIHAAQKR